MADKKKTKQIEVVNRKAAFGYFFRDTYEAGIVLRGTEIKSIRAGLINLNDSFCYFSKGELFVRNMYIKEYDFGNQFNHETRRARKLLLKKIELRKLEKKVKEKGFTIIPYRLFMTERGFAKLEVMLAEGKKSFNKRDSIKQKDLKRDAARQMKNVRF
ncbi:MAG: SsrA-binding protein SmpB [Bacteroidota bacterium]